MVATVRLDENLSNTLNALSIKLNKKKSDIIRDAIILYAKEAQNSHKSKILKAVDKVKKADLKENLALEGTLSDNL